MDGWMSLLTGREIADVGVGGCHTYWVPMVVRRKGELMSMYVCM